MNTKYFFVWVTVALFCLLFTGCGGNGTDNEGFGDEAIYEAESHTENHTENEVVLTVLGHETFYPIIELAQNTMNRAFANQGIEQTITIDFTSYNSNTRDDVYMRLGVMFMAGQGYDMFFWDYRHPFRNYARNGFLTDIYELIDNDPDINRDDFFTNVLEAYEYKGGLYVLPLTFGFSYVGINARLPQYIIDDFITYEFITIDTLLSMYNNIRHEHFTDFGHLNLTVGSVHWNPQFLFQIMAGSFIDFNNNVSKLNSPGFVGNLHNFTQAFDVAAMEWETVFFTEAPHMMRFNQFIESHAFVTLCNMLNPAAAFFTAIDPSFLHIIPLVDKYGRLLIIPPQSSRSATGVALCFPTAGDSNLAWEFSRHVFRAVLQYDGQVNVDNIQALGSFGNNTLATPILRDYFLSHVMRTLNRVATLPSGGMIRSEGLHRNIGTRSEVIESAMHRIWELSHMPVAVMEMNLPDVLTQGDLINQLMTNVRTPESFAQEAHNRLSLWFIEQ